MIKIKHQLLSSVLFVGLLGATLLAAVGEKDEPVRYIGEYHDEQTGTWLKGDNPRSRYYNHSAFCDPVISGLIGLRPRSDDCLVVHPLIPTNTWKWFALDKIYYHGRIVTIIWDQTGEKYKQGRGLFVYVNGKVVAHSISLERIEAKIK